MENLTLSITIGIFSSLVATAIFISISESIRKFAIPWYEDKIYRGVRIDGKWEIMHLGDEKKEIDGSSLCLQLKQKGEAITGIYTHTTDDDTDTYIVNGRIRDMYFLATAIPKSNRHIDGISFLLHIKNEKSKLLMQGGVLYESNSGEVESHIGITLAWKNS